VAKAPGTVAGQRLDVESIGIRQRREQFMLDLAGRFHAEALSRQYTAGVWKIVQLIIPRPHSHVARPQPPPLHLRPIIAAVPGHGAAALLHAPLPEVERRLHQLVRSIRSEASRDERPRAPDDSE